MIVSSNLDRPSPLSIDTSRLIEVLGLPKPTRHITVLKLKKEELFDLSALEEREALSLQKLPLKNDCYTFPRIIPYGILLRISSLQKMISIFQEFQVSDSFDINKDSSGNKKFSYEPGIDSSIKLNKCLKKTLKLLDVIHDEMEEIINLESDDIIDAGSIKNFEAKILFCIKNLSEDPKMVNRIKIQLEWSKNVCENKYIRQFINKFISTNDLYHSRESKAIKLFLESEEDSKYEKANSTLSSLSQMNSIPLWFIELLNCSKPLRNIILEYLDNEEKYILSLFEEKESSFLKKIKFTHFPYTYPIIIPHGILFRVNFIQTTVLQISRSSSHDINLNETQKVINEIRQKMDTIIKIPGDNTLDSGFIADAENKVLETMKKNKINNFFLSIISSSKQNSDREYLNSRNEHDEDFLIEQAKQLSLKEHNQQEANSITLCDLINKVTKDISLESDFINYIPTGIINAQDNQGKTALIHAVNVGNPIIISQLINAKANVNMPSIEGNTPLIHAASQKLPITSMIIDILLKAGANPLATNKEGKTALQIAQDKQNLRAVELLKSEDEKNTEKKINVDHKTNDVISGEDEDFGNPEDLGDWGDDPQPDPDKDNDFN